MIRLVTGVPGAGKGVYCVQSVIVPELVGSRRHIITNLALRVGPWVRRLGRDRSRAEKGLQAYLCDKYAKDFDLLKRVHVLDDDEFREFFLWRVNAETGELFKVPAERDDKGRVISFDKGQMALSAPVCYVMDEGWKFLWARAWQDTSKAMLTYQAQHRHLGDDLWIAAQNENQIEKVVRDLVQEYHSLVNHRYRKMLCWAQPNVISVLTSNESAKDRSKTLSGAPRVIRFDKEGIGGCFDTAGAIGVSGAAGDIESKTKGLPFWTFGLGIVLLALAIWFGSRGVGWAVSKAVAPDLKFGTNAVSVYPPGHTNALRGSSLQSGELEVVRRGPALPVVRVTGLMVVRGRPMVSLSDGRIFRGGDGQLEAVGRDWVRIKGETFYWQ